jgi:DNA-binding SARP family transcriptional activator/tetratricopeptide (TPR) repeat protein
VLHLRILGGAAVLASDGALTGAAGRRRALALLALIASARDDGLARDRALALLWPELDSERARNNLKQLVFSLRRALTPDVFATTGSSLRLDPNVITVDVWAYEQAIADGALENAVARYGGPFLDGFSVPGLPEFERWVEGERERLARVHAETLDTLAERARRAGQFEIAAAWRRHLAALDPLSARYAVSFVRALADAGDVPGALRHAGLFERLVRSELDTDAGPEMRLLVAQLRLRAESNGSRAVTSDELAILTTETRAAKASEMVAMEAVPAIAAPPPRSRLRAVIQSITPRVHPRRFAIACLAVANVIVISIAGRSKLFSPASAMGEVPPDLPATVAVFAFDGRGSSLTGELARATAELLTASLDGGTGLTAITAPADAQPVQAPSGDSTVVDAASAARTATRLGARLFVLGRIVEVGGRLRVTASLHDRARTDPPLARASAEGSANEMFEVVDRVASQLLAGRFPGTRGVLARVAATTAASLPAAKAYFTAEQQMGIGRFSAALDALRDAVRLDSNFAVAYYRMSHAAELIGDDAGTRDAAAAAVRFGTRLDDHYRRVVGAASARQQGDLPAADRAYTRLTLDYPTDADAWFGLGEAQFHLNPIRGRSATEARDAFLKVVDLDPRHVEALVHLARIDALRGDSASVDRWLKLAREFASDELIGRLALHVRSLGGMPPSGGVDRQRLQRATTLHRGPGVRDVLVGVTPQDADRFAAQFLAADVPGDVAAYGHRLSAYAASARGQFGRALRHLDEAQESDVDSDVEVRSLIVATAGSPVDSATIAQTRMAVERWQPSYSHDPDQSIDAIAHSRAHALLRLHRLGLIALRAGDTTTAAKAAERLVRVLEADSIAVPTAASLAMSLRARIAAAAGDSARALALLDQVHWSRISRTAAAEPLDRLLHADLLTAAGRYPEAAAWYSTLGSGPPHELPLIGYATLGLARASELGGDRAEAARQYQRLIELWRDADPPLQPIVAGAERRLAALNGAPR